MTHRLSDPHLAFQAWLVDGAQGEPPRDAALHASVCDECMSQVAALDALRALDLGRAMLPVARLAPDAAPRPAASIRRAGAAAAGVMGIAIVGVGATLLLASPTPSAPSGTSDLPGGDVLGATGTPMATPTDSPTASTAAATATATGAPATPRPSRATPRPPAVVPTQRPATPRPSAAASPTPSPTATPTPSPTATPSPSATVPPTPSPTVTPTPSPTPTPLPSPT